tara:strand:+ start:412 stop:873 length:462 start_codon:yes stop_codon:yes gene_type:complete
VIGDSDYAGSGKPGLGEPGLDEPGLDEPVSDEPVSGEPVPELPAAATTTWYLYIVETAAGALYTGITTDVARRVEQHRSGKGAKALRGKGPLTLRHQEPVGTRGDASRLEIAVKRMSVRRKRQWLAARISTDEARAVVEQDRTSITKTTYKER